MLVDSHCHLDCLDLEKYHGVLGQAIQAAQAEGVTHFLCVCININDFPRVVAVADQYDFISASVGLHPNEEKAESVSVATLVELAQHQKVVAIGETGLDYHYHEGDLDWQRERFATHIQAAKQLAKPLIIHTRAAPEDTIKIMREQGADEVGGVMHCFTESWEMAQQALDLGFYISFSGIVTFKNAKQIQEVATKVPADRMLIETDSPYLAPTPYRGKPNEPAYVRYVAEKIAELRGISFEEVADTTTENFYRCFPETAYISSR